MQHSTIPLQRIYLKIGNYQIDEQVYIYEIYEPFENLDYSNQTATIYEQSPNSHVSFSFSNFNYDDTYNTVLNNMAFSFKNGKMFFGFYSSDHEEQVFDPDLQETVYSGFHPEFWHGIIKNRIYTENTIQNTTISFSDYYSKNNSNWVKFLFPTQVYSIKDSSLIPLLIYKDDELILSGHSIGAEQINLGEIEDNAVLRLELLRNYEVDGISLSGTVNAEFINTFGSSDLNPPSISFFRLYGNDKPIEALSISPDVTRSFVFELDPVGGSLTEAKFSFEGENLPTEQISPNRYRVELPFPPQKEKVQMEIFAKDDGQNSIRYTFEVPVGTKEERQNSRLFNWGFQPVSGRLLLKLQKLENEQWVDLQAFSDRQVNVTSLDSISLADEWQNAGGFVAAHGGTYKVYAALLDATGKPIKNAFLQNLESQTTFLVSDLVTFLGTDSIYRNSPRDFGGLIEEYLELENVTQDDTGQPISQISINNQPEKMILALGQEIDGLHGTNGIEGQAVKLKFVAPQNYGSDFALLDQQNQTISEEGFAANEFVNFYGNQGYILLDELVKLNLASQTPAQAVVTQYAKASEAEYKVGDRIPVTSIFGPSQHLVAIVKENTSYSVTLDLWITE